MRVMSKSKKTLELKHAISFVFRFFIIISVGIGISGSLAILLLNMKIGPTYLEGISALSRLQTQLPFILFVTAFAQAAVLCLIVLLLTLFWSHSIAGPVMRFKKHLREFAQGKFPNDRFAFRQTDQLHGLAHAFSEMINAQRERDMRSLALLIEAQKLLDECEMLKKEGKDDTSKFKADMKDLRETYLQIKEIYPTCRQAGRKIRL